MPQVFPKSANAVARIVVIGVPLLMGGTGVGLAAFYRSDYTTGRNNIVEQPVPFSHLHHVSQLGIDCRYCHTSVETSSFAGLPPTKTCMNCHQQIWTGSSMLNPVRESYANNTPIVWNRVHNVPHYAYFNHSIHVAKGVGCQTCHGKIDEMNLTFQSSTLLMEWCINCHRNPHEFIRPTSEVYSMTWAPGRLVDGKPQVWVREDLPHWGRTADGKDTAAATELLGKERPRTQKELGAKLKDLYEIRDNVSLISCSMCHR